MKKIELLSPAGDMERLKMAVAYGADAVYLAGTAFGSSSGEKFPAKARIPKAVPARYTASAP